MVRKCLVIAVLLLSVGCASQPGPAPSAGPPSSLPTAPQSAHSSSATDCPLCGDPDSPEVLAAYAAAVEAAKYPAPEKISRDLTPLLESTDGLIWNDQGQLLMSTWTKAKYYSDVDTFRRGESFNLHGDTWITAVPFLRDFCRQLDLETPLLNLRLEQLLGLPPANGKDALLEIWVDPTDVFRPCPDPEISDHVCQVEIPVFDRNDQQPWDCTLKRQVSGRYVTVHPGHLQWMCYNWTLSYGNEDPLENYPWTALGYTYDWGNPKDPRGLSEYVAVGGSRVVFESLTPTQLYCTDEERSSSR